MKGHLTTKNGSWYAIYDVFDPATGKRRRKWHKLDGAKGKREADEKWTAVKATIQGGTFIAPDKMTVADFVRMRVDQWEASAEISARTAQRYRQLVENQIVPHLGTKSLQKLRPVDIEQWHTSLRNGGRARGEGGLAVRTIGHAHRVLSKALSNAAKNDLVGRNVAKWEPAPKVAESELVIVQDVAGLVDKLEGDRLKVPAVIALFTGMRIGEVLALRWSRVDLDGKVIQVREALEQTRAHGIRFKSPKSRAGRRDITLPDILVTALRDHRKRQMELRMQMGAGRSPEDALLFATLDGGPLSPNAVSAAWADLAERLGVPQVTFHCLRHTHASQLIDAGVDIVTISRRLGHAKPDITLRIYAHLFQKDDGKAAAAINAALG